MKLTIEEIRRANSIFLFLKNQKEEYFEYTGIEKCKRCKGTGLIYFTNGNGTLGWDTKSYCNDCKGVGFKGIKGDLQIDDVNFLCIDCGGLGCGKCRAGIVDWVSHIMKKEG